MLNSELSLRKFGKSGVVQRSEVGPSAEALRLKAELRRVTEERDTLKKPPATLPRGSGKVSFHVRTLSGVRATEDVPGATGKLVWRRLLAALADE
ncbi:hypothetical isxac3 transposase orfa (fragment) protein [Xanthomonas albilineans GPE PC73]|uniref:Hypothetical isxac3 transposase orfa protein n=1 Tax=Xanthomonas albilineans (strain GPE PC73 / CFBP 7063) TaxID=380358 RepID=D2UGF2_XANAP